MVHEPLGLSKILSADIFAAVWPYLYFIKDTTGLVFCLNLERSFLLRFEWPTHELAF